MLVTTGTNAIADGEVGDEKWELGKMDLGCVVMKTLEMWGNGEVSRAGKKKSLTNCTAQKRNADLGFL